MRVGAKQSLAANHDPLCLWLAWMVRDYSQFTYGLNASMAGIVAALYDPAAAQWAVVRVGVPVKMTDWLGS
eukprot:158707-Chlamydomonas_euryale.AAC.1